MWGWGEKFFLPLWLAVLSKSLVCSCAQACLCINEALSGLAVLSQKGSVVFFDEKNLLCDSGNSNVLLPCLWGTRAVGIMIGYQTLADVPPQLRTGASSALLVYSLFGGLIIRFFLRSGCFILLEDTFLSNWRRKPGEAVLTSRACALAIC